MFLICSFLFCMKFIKKKTIDLIFLLKNMRNRYMYIAIGGRIGRNPPPPLQCALNTSIWIKGSESICILYMYFISSPSISCWGTAHVSISHDVNKGNIHVWHAYLSFYVGKLESTDCHQFLFRNLRGKLHFLYLCLYALTTLFFFLHKVEFAEVKNTRSSLPQY